MDSEFLPFDYVESSHIDGEVEYQSFILRPYGGDNHLYSFLAVPAVRTGRLAVLPSRETLGPPDPDVDDTLSTYNVMDLTGGIGVRILNPSSDLNRSAWSTSDTRYTDGWTNPPYVTSGKPADAVGDARWFIRIGDSLYGLWGQGLHKWISSTQQWGSRTDLTVNPVNRPVLWQGYAYFPCGSSGYVAITESAPGTLDSPEVVAGAATPTVNEPEPTTVPRPAMFTVYNQNLYCITTDGFMALSTDNDGDGLAENGEWQWPWHSNRLRFVRCDRSLIPKNFLPYIARDGEPAMWLITNKGALRYDENNFHWTETNLWNVPPHPNFGDAAIVFGPGEDLWISSGGGDMVQYTNANVTQWGQGPGGTAHGLPERNRGSIVAASADAAHMYCLMKGDSVLDGTPTFVEDTSGADNLYVPDAEAITTVLAYNRKGWHPLWESEEPTGTPTDIYVSDAPGDSAIGVDYRVFWSCGETAYSMPCRLSMYSARQGRQAGIDHFRPESYIELGEFNGGSIAKKKLISHAAILMNQGSVSNPDADPVDYILREYCELEYLTDTHDPNDWQSLGAAWNPRSRTVLPFGLSDDGLWSRGLGCYWIKLRLWLRNTGTILMTPDVRALSLAYMTTPMDAGNIVITVPLPVYADSTGKDRDVIQRLLYSFLQPELDGMPEFLELRYNNKCMRVYVAGISATEYFAQDMVGALTLNLIQVKTNDGFTLGND